MEAAADKVHRGKCSRGDRRQRRHQRVEDFSVTSVAVRFDEGDTVEAEMLPTENVPCGPAWLPPTPSASPAPSADGARTPSWIPPTPFSSSSSCPMGEIISKLASLDLRLARVEDSLATTSTAALASESKEFDDRFAALELRQDAAAAAHDSMASSVASLETEVAHLQSVEVSEALRGKCELLEKQVNDLSSQVKADSMCFSALPGSSTPPGLLTPPPKARRQRFPENSPQKLTAHLLNHLDVMREGIVGLQGSCKSCPSDSDAVLSDPTAIFVGGLSDNMTADDLRCIFADVDGDIRARVLCDRDTGASRRCGFVHFATVAACQVQLQRCQNGTLEFAGRQLRIAPKRRPPPRRL